MSYGFGNLHWAAAHVVSMFGAFCAGVAVYGFRAANDDVPGWQVRMPSTFMKVYIDDYCAQETIQFNGKQERLFLL